MNKVANGTKVPMSDSASTSQLRAGNEDHLYVVPATNLVFTPEPSILPTVTEPTRCSHVVGRTVTRSEQPLRVLL